MFMKKALSSMLLLFFVVNVDLQAELLNLQGKQMPGAKGLTYAKPFAVFKAYKGAKFPYMLRFDPAQSTFTSLMCGAQDENGDVHLAKTSEDLGKLIVLRSTLKSLDGGFQIDKIYPGFRDSYIGRSIEEIMSIAGLLSREAYAGNFVIDEMIQGVDMKWVFQDVAGFKSFRSFLEKSISEKNLSFSKKPYLLIDIIDGFEDLDESDADFLNQYFIMVDPEDEDVVEFYNQAIGLIKDITTCGVDFGPAGEDFGIKFMRLIEKDCSKFKMGEWAADGAKLAFTALTTAILVKLFMDYVGKPVQDKASSGVGAAGIAIKDRINKAPVALASA